MSPPGAAPLPTIRVAEVQEPWLQAADLWLVEDLWTHRAATVLAGPPKCAKTFLAVELALSVASGTPVLGHWPVHSSGPVLFFGAEDSPVQLKARFQAAAQRRELSLWSVEVYLLGVPVLRLDQASDRAQLECTLAGLRPRLLVIDPFVRTHRLDENSSTEISGLLAYLRQLERDYELAILLVHHTRKAPSPSLHPGQALRGSSDIQAWADTLMYLDRAEEGLSLAIEHRAAAAPPPIALRLQGQPTPHLELLAPGPEPLHPSSLSEEILLCLARAGSPLRLEELRARLGSRKQRVVDALAELAREGKVEHLPEGYVLKPRPWSRP